MTTNIQNESITIKETNDEQEKKYNPLLFKKREEFP
ncbi:MAG: hypothetical protein KatS3mg129_2042 [Leptospiraceae bacterium]|nr:MAG: hypothetical protein KatS3mg129_2042 [Leptospiraceae bacterium]